MAPINKPKVIKSFEKLTDVELEQIKLVYPRGFRKHLVEFTGMNIDDMDDDFEDEGSDSTDDIEV